jgi:hypothetical protein
MDANSDYLEVVKELSELYNIEEMLSFNELNIQEKLSENAAKIWHFTELYNREKNAYDEILELKDKLVHRRYEYYKTKNNLLLKQNEIEKYYLPSDPEILKFNQIVRKQKWRVEFYDGLRKALEKQQWSMKSYLDSMKAGL